MGPLSVPQGDMDHRGMAGQLMPSEKDVNCVRSDRPQYICITEYGVQGAALAACPARTNSPVTPAGKVCNTPAVL